MSEQVVTDVLWLMTDRGPSEPLIVSRQGGGLKVRSIQRVVARARTRARLSDRITPHSLRHTFATHLLEAGTDIQVVSTQSRHLPRTRLPGDEGISQSWRCPCRYTPAARRWSTIIDEYWASGLNLRDFANQRDINRSTLASWRSKLGRSSTSRCTKVCFTEPVVRDEEGAAEGKNPVPTRPSLVIRLRRPDADLVVEPDTDLPLLRRVVDAPC